VRAALREDQAAHDVTTAALFPRPTRARAIVRARHAMTVAGIAVAVEAFRTVDPAVRIVRTQADGAAVAGREAVLIVEGPAPSLLKAERVALNFLQRLSGIATLTARYCRAVRGYGTAILDTRKTTPGLRLLEKWAVRLGGGTNHRFSLRDGILIKDNHLALLRAQHIGIAEACRLARTGAPRRRPVIVEVQTLANVRDALAGHADRILLDNMPLSQVKAAVTLIDRRARIEVSGGMTVARARACAAAGADYVSVGALTHSAPAADLSMDVIALTERNTRR
jgi:nicotinate-nucleotide pyrophosphorylase (carboxylating)